jgi:NitT/TauT family transport system permease protein
MRLINRHPGKLGGRLLAAAPFAAVVATYFIASAVRLAANPYDKLLPGLAQMATGLNLMAFTQDPATGDYLMLDDTLASLSRLSQGLGISVTLAFVVGVAVGLLPFLRRLFIPFIAAFSMVPPLAILPILFILTGIGETSKVVLIVIGTAPFIIRDMIMRVEELPKAQLIKAQTLGASTWQIALRVVVPQMLPRLIDALRLSLGPAWIYLISAEAIAAQDGLGYRIFLVRRYFAMDIIIPYVIWITLLAFIFDVALRLLQRFCFPWFAGAKTL